MIRARLRVQGHVAVLGLSLRGAISIATSPRGEGSPQAWPGIQLQIWTFTSMAGSGAAEALRSTTTQLPGEHIAFELAVSANGFYSPNR